jgi:hypothetical protein
MTFVVRVLVTVLLVAFIILGVSYFVPLSVPYYQDFSVMYFTGRALINGIAIYDYPAQLDFVHSLTPQGFTFLPYPYPPWYALATLPLGFFPIEVAARIWFFLNLIMLGLSAWILSIGWKPLARIMGILGAVLFIPAFGLLVVGQYSLPVLLGTVLFVESTRRKQPVFVAGALLLMTFKPHIGGLLFLAGFIWLCFDGDKFARRAIFVTLLGAFLLGVLGFLADRAWPWSYYLSLARYQQLPGVQSCGLCASLSVAVVRSINGESSTLAAIGVGVGMVLLTCLVLMTRYRPFLKSPLHLMNLFSTLTLLVDPYLLSYDYVLLLAPLAWLARRTIWVLPVYLLPWFVLWLGRDANSLLSISGIVTFVLILHFIAHRD